MNAKELIGLKIIDKNGKDVAKITEFSFNVKTYKITNIIASSGNPLSKKFYQIDTENIIALGDYLLIDASIDDLTKFDKLPETNSENIRINESIGKTVLDSEGNIAGKITNVDIDFDKYEIDGLTFSKSSSFGKPKVSNNINKEDIITFGDYIIINKTFNDATEEKTEEKAEEEDITEKVKVDID